jgi:hypothetical protein
MPLQPADPEFDRLLKRLARRSPADVEGVLALMLPLAEAEARARLSALAKPDDVDPATPEAAINLFDSGFSPWLRVLLQDELDPNPKVSRVPPAARSLLRTCAAELARIDTGAVPPEHKLALTDRIAGLFRRTARSS